MKKIGFSQHGKLPPNIYFSEFGALPSHIDLTEREGSIAGFLSKEFSITRFRAQNAQSGAVVIV